MLVQKFLPKLSYLGNVLIIEVLLRKSSAERNREIQTIGCKTNENSVEIMDWNTQEGQENKQRINP